jgi:microcystin-dependent protein
MMDPLGLTITNAGLAAFTSAQLSGDINLLIAHVALTDTAFIVAPTLTALPGEFRRLATFSGAAVGPDTVHLMVRDAEPVTYGVRGFGLFLPDGTLFAVYGQADRLVEKAIGSVTLLALDLRFPPEQVATIVFGDTNFLDPPATEQIAGVAAIATQAQVDGGSDDTRFVTPKKLASRIGALTTALTGVFLPRTQRGAANGVASLGSDGKVPSSQLTTIIATGTITLFFGAAAPAGWAICDGSLVQLADGTKITTPDMRGRVAVGASADHLLGAPFGQTTASTSTGSAKAGVTLTTSTNSGYAGGGTQSAIAAGAQGTPPSLNDPGHTHTVSVDVTQPSLALNYIMKL